MIFRRDVSKKSSIVLRAVFALALACLAYSGAYGQSSAPSMGDTGSGASSDLAAQDSISSSAGILTKNGEPLYPLSPERRELLRDYAKTVNIWRFVEFFTGLGILGIILFTGTSAKLRDWARSARRSYLVVWLYTALLLVVMAVLNFPFTYYRGYHLEAQYEFMNQSFAGWLGEQALGLLIAMVVVPVPVYFFYLLVQRVRRWWLGFSLVALPIMVVFIVITPVLIMPLFNKFEPLQDKRLESEILALAEKAGIEGSDVFQVNASKQSSKVNAYVTGLFGTKRIVLYDTLIKGFTTDEIKFVMGHEMGHYMMRHIWWGLLIAVAMLLALLWLTEKTIHKAIQRWKRPIRFDRLGDLASLPLVMGYLSVFNFFSQPISNSASRYMEHQSDIYGMRVTDIAGDAAAVSFDKLSAYNLSDPDPHPVMEFWFYSHPALQKRMEFVRSYRDDT